MNKEIIDKANDHLLEIDPKDSDEETLDETPKEEVKEKNNAISEEKTPKTEDTVDNSDKKADTDVSDVVKNAQELNAQLKKQLEELETANSNVFEENENLKKKIEEQEALKKIAVENAAMKAKIEEMSKNTLIDSLLSSGKITKDLRAWAESLPFDQLKEFSDKAPKIKTILDEKNTFQLDDEEMAKWKAEQQKSRIL